MTEIFNSKKKRLTWDELIANSDDEIVQDSLGRPAQNSTAQSEKHIDSGYLAITLNHPQTKLFLSMTSDKQKQLYGKIWNCIRVTFGMHCEHKYVYEFTQKGQVHLHGYVKMPSVNYYIAGAISDIVKKYLQLLPKRFSMFNTQHYYPEYERYRCPSICVQHFTDITEWAMYMNKAQSYDNI